MTKAISPPAHTGLRANLHLVVFFAISLFLAWSWIYGQQNADTLGTAGSDSFLVVQRIAKAHELRWYEQSYISQFGLSSMILSALYKVVGNISVARFALICVQVFCLLSAVAWALAAPLVYRRLGAAGLIVLWLSLAASPWLMAFAHSLYWAQFTLVLPCIWALTSGGMMLNGNKARRRFLLGVSFLIFVKALCGYEYITAVTLLACAGYVVAALDHDAKPTLRALTAVFAACVIGFALAFAVHSMQLFLQFGLEGVQHIVGRATLHSGTGADSGRPDILIARLRAQPGMEEAVQALSTELASHQWLFFRLSFMQYFRFPALQFTPSLIIPFWLFALIGCAALLWSGVLLSRYWKRGGSGNLAFPATAMWCFATALALLAAVSWQVLAWRHMTMHYHLNGLLFSIGLVPFGSLWLVSLAGRIIHVPRVLPTAGVWTLLAFSMVTLIVGSRFHQAHRQALAFQTIAAASTPSTIHASLDAVKQEPAVTEIARGLSLPSTRIIASGWAYSRNGANITIELRVDGLVVAGARTGIPRNDVVAVFPEAPPDSGFRIVAVVPGKVAAGRVEVILIDELGNQRRFLR